MLVALVAERELREHHPAVWAQVETLMAKVTTPKEKDHAFVESATFADLYNKKMYGDKGKVDPYLDLFNNNAELVNTDSHWHFADLPYYDGITEEEAGDNKELPELNAIEGIRRLQDNLKGIQFTEDESYRLRCLIHYVGDIHQPFHGISKFSKKRINGDYGGNTYYLSYNRYGSLKNMHSLWDSGMGKYNKGIYPKLSTREWSKLNGIGDTIMEEWPRSSVDVSSLDPADWAQESYDIAVDFGYVDVYYTYQERKWVHEEYLEKGLSLVHKRIAMAGYRLADTIVTFFE